MSKISEFLNNSMKVVKLERISGTTFKTEEYYISLNRIPQVTPKLSNKYTPNAKDKIYIYPESGIPRFKLKEYCQKNKISLVRDPNKANARFVGLKYMFNGISSNYRYFVKKEEMSKFLNISKETLTEYQIGLLRSMDCVMDYYTYNYLSGVYNPIFANYSRESISRSPVSDILYCNIPIFESSLYSMFRDIDTRTDIFSSEDLIEDLSTGLVIDKKMYSDLSRLFESSDTSNHVLAMESMANSDFQKSAVYLLNLMKEYRTQISSSKVRNHVNFTALRNYFDWELGYLNGDRIVTKLRNKNLGTKENIDKLLPLVMSEITVDNKLANFKVKGLEYTGEYDDEVFDELPQSAPIENLEENLVVSELQEVEGSGNSQINDDGQISPGAGV